MFARLGIVLLPVTALLHGADPISDEGIRVHALEVLFPRMSISRTPGRSIDQTWTTETRAPLFFPDALATEPVYAVVGTAANDSETCAARDLLSLHTSNERELRLRAYPCAMNHRGDLCIVVQYRFVNAKPSADCPSIAFVSHIALSNNNWEERERLILESHHHNQLLSIRWVLLPGDSDEKLAIESDCADHAGDHVSFMYILSVAADRLEKILVVPTRVHIVKNAETWTQVLDTTRVRDGKTICFQRTDYSLNHIWLATPQVREMCFVPGENGYVWNSKGDLTSVNVTLGRGTGNTDNQMSASSGYIHGSTLNNDGALRQAYVIAHEFAHVEFADTQAGGASIRHDQELGDHIQQMYRQFGPKLFGSQPGVQEMNQQLIRDHYDHEKGADQRAWDVLGDPK